MQFKGAPETNTFEAAYNVNDKRFDPIEGDTALASESNTRIQGCLRRIR